MGREGESGGVGGCDLCLTDGCVSVSEKVCPWQSGEHVRRERVETSSVTRRRAGDGWIRCKRTSEQRAEPEGGNLSQCHYQYQCHYH